jgi:hypothetical protein
MAGILGEGWRRGLKWETAPKPGCPKTAMLKKEEFPGYMSHAAWELLSPDLRCFCVRVS